MKRVSMTLIVLNLAEVAVDMSLGGAALIGTDLDPDDTLPGALAELVTDAQIVNHASPKLVGVFDAPDGYEIVYRVRTGSHSLGAGMRWQSVSAPLSVADRRLLELAQESEKP